MNEERLRALLRVAAAPGERDAEARALRAASEALAERRPSGRPLLPRLAVALAATALLGALLLSPAGARVRDWIGDVFAGVPGAQPALTEIPGGGRLLVQAADGPWVVRPDGSRRLLGDYVEATWSPHGLFVAAASRHALSAVEPDGDPRWSLSGAGPVADPRWSPSGFRIAYRAGRGLRVVAGDGTGDALLDRRVAPVAPAWSPLGVHQLAYVDAGGEVRILEADGGRTVGRAASLPGVATLDWGGSGSTLLEASRRSLRLRQVTVEKLEGAVSIGGHRRVALPAGARLGAAALSPRGDRVAVLLAMPLPNRPPRGEVALIDVADGSLSRLFSAPRRFSDLAWSPDGRRLLVAWRDADQWLFVPVGERGRIRAVGGIAGEFSPGGGWDASFPRVEGWCCPLPDVRGPSPALLPPSQLEPAAVSLPAWGRAVGRAER